MSYKRILVGTDGSSGATAAVKAAAALANASAAELTILSSFQRPDQSLVEAIWEAGALKEGRESVPEEFEWRVSAAGVAQVAVDEASQVAAAEGVEARKRTEEGRPSDALLRVAEEEESDLIVVGNRGMHGVERFLLGSTPDRISHDPFCDLLIVATPTS